MEKTTKESSFRQKKPPSGRRSDTPLHAAARAGNLAEVRRILSLDGGGEEKGGLNSVAIDVDDSGVIRRELIARQNEAGETAFYLAAEDGHTDVLEELLSYAIEELAKVKTRNGCDALHAAAKHGHVDVVRTLLRRWPVLATTADSSNCTALYSAATQGHVEVVMELLAVDDRLLAVAKSNGKTALHSAARGGHVEVVRALVGKGISGRQDLKGQTALHMAVKGRSVQVVTNLLTDDPSVVNFLDKKGNAALHVATRKGRVENVRELLAYKDINLNALNKLKETALDVAEKSHFVEAASEIKNALREAGAENGRRLSQPVEGRELKQTVSDIKHNVHSQLMQTEQTQRRVTGIAKDLHKLHREGINNTVNSVTVLAVLIATIAFAAIYTVPGGYVQNLDKQSGSSGPPSGQANVVKKLAFQIFFLFDSVALFISLAVVVVQISLVASESKAQKRVIFVINKLMWVACVSTSVAFLALSFIVVGHQDMWIAITVALIGGSLILVTVATLGYLVVKQRFRRMRSRKIRRSSRSRSHSWSIASQLSDSDMSKFEHEKIYAL